MYTNVLVDKQTLSGRLHRRLVPMIVWGGGLSRGLGDAVGGRMFFYHVHKLDLFSVLKLRLVIIVKSRRSHLPCRPDSQGRCRKQGAGVGGASSGEAAGRGGEGIGRASSGLAGEGEGRQTPAALLLKASVADRV